MFKIELYVEDKYLAEVLRGVSGKAKNLQVIPVVNVVQEKDKHGKPNGKLKQDATHTVGLFCKAMKELGDEVNSKVAKAALSKIGFAPTSYNHFLRQAVNAKLIKKHGSGNSMTYSWV